MMKKYREIWFSIMTVVGLLLVSISGKAQQEILGNDIGALSNFGAAIAIDGDFAVVGAPTQGDDSYQGSRAFVFQYIGSTKTWTVVDTLQVPVSKGFVYALSYRDDGSIQNATLENGVGPSGFGKSVAISGNYVAISAPDKRRSLGNSRAISGHIFIFKKNGPNWQIVSSIYERKQWSEFGRDIALNNNILAVGDPRKTTEDGVVEIYNRVGDTFNHSQTIEHEVNGVEDFDHCDFGEKITMGGENGQFLAVPTTTAKWSNDVTLDIYQLNNLQYSKIQRIIEPKASLFGSAINFSKDGNRLAVSAPGANFAYCFQRNGNTYEKNKTLKPALNSQYFGHDIKIEGDVVAVSAPEDNGGKGAVYLYKLKQGGSNLVVEDIKLQHNSFYDEPGYGKSIYLFDKELMVGATGHDKGALYVYDLVPPAPINLVAEGEESDQSITISWEDNDNINSTFRAESYTIYRNAELTAVPENKISFNSFTDSGLPAGTVTSYSVQGKNAFYQSEKTFVVGKTKANGSISGKVFAGESTTVGIPNVALAITPFNSYVLFPGNKDAFAIADIDNFPFQKIAMQFWIRNNDVTKPAGIISYATTSGDNTFLIANPENLEIYITNALGQQVTTGKTNIKAEWGQWVQITVNWDGSTGILQIFKNGNLVYYNPNIGKGFTVPTKGKLVIGNDQDSFGGGFTEGQAFKGHLDEIRIWNKTLSAGEIAQNYNSKFQEKAEGLVLWWALDGESAINPRGAYDNMRENKSLNFNGSIIWNPLWLTLKLPPINQIALTNTSGNYKLTNIYFKDSKEFTVRPLVATGRDIDPLTQSVTLTSEQPVIENINFRDYSLTYISGKVLFKDLECPLEGAIVRIPSLNLSDTTNSEGEFTIGGVSFGSHEVIVNYKNHTFEQNGSRSIPVTGPVENILFEDNTRFTLSGVIAGGSCLVGIGDGSLEISTPSGCFSIPKISENGAFEIDLPAFPHIEVAVLSLDNATYSDLIFNLGKGYFRAIQTIEMDEGDTILNFIYSAEPDLIVDGFSEAEECTLEVMEQGSIKNLKFQVVERYGEQVCPANEGTFEIIDIIGDIEGLQEFVLDSTGNLNYRLVAGEPNVIGGFSNPYQKKIEILVTTPVKTVSWSKQVVVTGSKPRSKTFTTVSPEIPLMILRDPPGDASSAFIEEEVSQCINVSYALSESSSKNIFAEVKVGTAFATGLGFTTETEIFAAASGGMTLSKTNISTTETEYCITTNNKFSTSGNDYVIGTAGDVFVGAALNIIYALTDVLEVNENCEVELSQTVMYGNQGIATQYFYTEEHIRNVVIPDLLNLSIVETDRMKKQKYLDQMDVWKQTLALNEQLKAEAEINDNFNGPLTLSNNVQVEYFSTASSSTSRTIEFNTYMDTEVALTMGVDIAGSGFSAGVQVNTMMNIGKSNTTTNSKTNTVGFTINDDDLGDSFSFLVKKDPVYGTPVFDLIAGSTSCPVEPGTNAREGVRITMDKNLEGGVDPNQTANFKLTLANTAESGGNRKYYVAASPESNPDGAVLLINGISISDVEPYTIARGESVDATLTVGRGPNAYSYENLKIGLYSQCDGNIADVTAFSVRFVSPCSSVNLFRPEGGWVVNRGHNDSLKIILNEYDKDLLTDLTIQYSIKGRNQWKDAFAVNPSQLEEDFTSLSWDVSTNTLIDGAYDIRAKVQCSGGTNYSQTISGFIDRQAPVALGIPEPADGVYGLNDEITVRLSEEIDCQSVNDSAVILVDIQTKEILSAELVCNGNEIYITPSASSGELEGRSLQVSLINIKDLQGNYVTDPINWNMVVSLNPVNWNKAAFSKSVPQGAPEEKFTARLRNASAAFSAFEIIGLPEWLMVEEPSGELNSQAEQLLNFNIDSTIDPGDYSVTIFAKSSEGEAPLKLNLKVLCPDPTWEVDASDFANQMTLVASVYAADIPFSEENDLLAAFVNNQLRGVAKVQKVVPQDEYPAFLTIYGDTEGEIVDFRLWDASACETKVLDGQYRFKSDTAYGSATNFDSLFISNVNVQQISLEEGWSWISFNVEMSEGRIDDVLSGIRPQEGLMIKSQNHFSHYTPGHSWVGSLRTIAPGIMYKIKTANPINEKISKIGKPIDSNSLELDLMKGWNWLGFLPQEKQEINIAMSGYEAKNGDLLKSILNFSEYSGSDWVGSLMEMEPGKGYMLKAGNGAKFKYASARRSLPQATEDWIVNAAEYEKTMNMTGLVNIAGVQVSNENSILAAFYDNQIRGVAHPIFVMNRWMYFLTVYTNSSDEEYTFKVYDPEMDSIVMLYNKEGFTELKGIPAVPYSWFTQSAVSDTEEDTTVPNPTILSNNENLIPLDFYMLQNYPNPFRNSSTIRYYLPELAQVEMIIFDLTGKRRTAFAGQQQAGEHVINLDAEDFNAGLYYYALIARTKNGDKVFKQMKKMLVVR